MGMDKIDNVKSAIAPATAVDSKKRPGIVASASNSDVGYAGVTVASSAVNSVSHSKNVSTVSSKTLTETLERSEEKVREAVEEINSELVKLQSEVGFSVDGKGANLVVTVKEKNPERLFDKYQARWL